MAQFDVYRTRGEAARHAPFLVVLQSDFLADLASVIVAPMKPVRRTDKVVARLHVEADFLDGPHFVAPEQMISLPRSALGSRAGSIAQHRPALLAALDFVFLGF